MDDFFYRFYSYGIILQLLAVVHFAKRRPNLYWLWIIFIGGGLGAIAYFLVEVLPELTQTTHQFGWWERRKGIRRMQAVVQDNPAPGNYEELAALLFDDGNFAAAKEAYDKAITSRISSRDPFYRRALCHLDLGDFNAARSDLERVISEDPTYDFGRAQGLLAHAYARTGEADAAEANFKAATESSTLSETMYNYADFLRQHGRAPEARQWAERILSKRATLPRYLKRRERPWFWRAAALLKQLPH
jgi:hypothetical protein